MARSARVSYRAPYRSSFGVPMGLISLNQLLRHLCCCDHQLLLLSNLRSRSCSLAVFFLASRICVPESLTSYRQGGMGAMGRACSTGHRKELSEMVCREPHFNEGTALAAWGRDQEGLETSNLT